MSGVISSPKIGPLPSANAEQILREKRRKLAEANTGPQGGTLITSSVISGPILGTSSALGGVA